MNRIFLVLVCLSLFILGGCQSEDNSNIKSEGATEIRSENITIGYGYNSYIAVITDKEEMKQLEDLFNGAEFDKADTSIQQPFLSINFNTNNLKTSFRIDNKDIIEVSDGSFMKSKQIKFDKLYSIYDKYLSKK